MCGRLASAPQAPGADDRGVCGGGPHAHSATCRPLCMQPSNCMRGPPTVPGALAAPPQALTPLCPHLCPCSLSPTPPTPIPLSAPHALSAGQYSWLPGTPLPAAASRPCAQETPGKSGPGPALAQGRWEAWCPTAVLTPVPCQWRSSLGDQGAPQPSDTLSPSSRKG